MKNLLLLSILLIFGCEETTAPEPEDCAGVAGGTAVLDNCGVCNGIDAYVAGSCYDCEGVAFGTAELDNCNICDSDKTNDCVPDCEGTWGGESVVDECGVCGGDGIVGCTTEPEDCAGDAGGTAVLDNCGVCDSDLTNDCVPDCAGVWGGTSILSGCDNICNSTAVVDCAGVCGGNNSTCADCAGVPNGDSALDCDGNCLDPYFFTLNLGNGVCNDGAGLNLSCEEFNCDNGDCIDCAGECNGDSWMSDCGCVDESNHGNDCDDCAGVPNGDSFLDCTNVNCFPNEYYYYLGDGWCDDGTGGEDWIDFNCDQFDCDGGDCLDCATVMDIDENVYQTIQIGEQLWMAENLKVTKYRDGSEITYITNNGDWNGLSTGAYGDYDNIPTNSETYGRLYNWYTVDDSRGVCPEGFHVPSDEEYTILTDYLGGISVAGGKMKEVGFEHWGIPNIGATNESGFMGLPAGHRDNANGTYDTMGYGGYFWSSSESSSTNAWYRLLYYGGSDVNHNNYPKQFGFSVRCLGD